MVSIESIREQFDELGIDPSDEVTNKCIEICSRYDIDDPVEFVETWMAYSVSKLNGAEPTVEYLRDMESNEFAHKARKAAAAAPPSAVSRLKQGSGFSSPSSNDSLGRVGVASAGGLVIYNNMELDSTESDVLGSYGCITPKAKKPVSRLHGQTPDHNRAQFSPASYSPITSKKSHSHDGPNNSGNVVYTFGSGTLLKQISWSSANAALPVAKRQSVAIEIPLFKGNHLTDGGSESSGTKFMSSECKYMFDSSYERVLILGDRIYEGGKQICQRLNELRSQEQTEGSEDAIAEDDREACVVEQVAIHHVDYPSTDVISVMGRIVVLPERKDDRLAIVDFDEMTLRCTKLDFSKMKLWSVFPGETVVLEGINPRGNAFEVRKIHYERKLELPRAPMQLGRELKMVVAAAPFTDKEDLLYEKLSDLLTYCSNNCPDVLILTGPFGDSSNSLFSTIAETFEEYFEKIIVNIMSAVSQVTEVLIVSNHEDIMSMFVYPSFPYKINRYFKNLHFLPDPCVVSINGFEVGITSVDVIKDISDAEEIGAPMGDKVKRAFNYLFHHKAFYPLNPPPDNLPLDMDLLNEFGNLARVPNMMICPGDLRCYVRDFNGCVCINPGRLVDRTSGEGTFARIVVHPPESETAAPMNYVACQVVKS